MLKIYVNILVRLYNQWQTILHSDLVGEVLQSVIDVCTKVPPFTSDAYIYGSMITGAVLQDGDVDIAITNADDGNRLSSIMNELIQHDKFDQLTFLPYA